MAREDDLELVAYEMRGFLSASSAFIKADDVVVVGNNPQKQVYAAAVNEDQTILCRQTAKTQFEFSVVNWPGIIKK